MTQEKGISITDVNKDQESVHVFFGQTGQVEITPVENRPTVMVEIYTDELDPVDHLRIVDDKQQWDLRSIDNYFHERRGDSAQTLAESGERLARDIGTWFVSYKSSANSS